MFHTHMHTSTTHALVLTYAAAQTSIYADMQENAKSSANDTIRTMWWKLPKQAKGMTKAKPTAKPEKHGGKSDLVAAASPDPSSARARFCRPV